mmetsp:Transcript_36333/g.84983  ORF Transcript_36333/g.84983 Transcript_36333/m.84983 type:complete len:216 (-) Transcript_36333:155-802(-)
MMLSSITLISWIFFSGCLMQQVEAKCEGTDNLECKSVKKDSCDIPWNKKHCPQLCCNEEDDTADDKDECVDKKIPGYFGKFYTCENFTNARHICEIPVPGKDSMKFGDYCCNTCKGDKECNDVEDFYLNPKKKKSDCKEVAKKKRCKKNFKGVMLSDLCKKSCDMCPTILPTKTPQPTLPEPSFSPSKFPTALPSSPCGDTPNYLYISGKKKKTM